MLLIDQEEANAAGDMVSFIPTYDNISDFTVEEFTDDFEGYEHLIEPAMTAEYSQFYEQVVNIAREQDVNLDDKDDRDDLAADLGLSKEQRRLLHVRHTMASKLGANEQFLGNGMTKDNNAENSETPFDPAKAGFNYGPLETFTYDKNPQTLGKLETAGIVTRIPLNNA